VLDQMATLDAACGPVTEEPGRRPPGGSGGSLPRASRALGSE